MYAVNERHTAELRAEAKSFVVARSVSGKSSTRDFGERLRPACESGHRKARSGDARTWHDVRATAGLI